MTRIVQEKFQVASAPNANDDAGGGWASDASARDRKRLTTRDTQSGRYQRCGYNALPPGSNIEDQECADIPSEPMSPGNMGNGDQATTDVTPTSLRTGFDRKRLAPTDDMYTREHNDAFYDEVTVDGVTGFVERNNMLDRL